MGHLNDVFDKEAGLHKPKTPPYMQRELAGINLIVRSQVLSLADALEALDAINPEHFSTIVRYAIKYGGLTVADIANGLGTSASSVERWLMCVSIPYQEYRTANAREILDIMRKKANALEGG